MRLRIPPPFSLLRPGECLLLPSEYRVLAALRYPRGVLSHRPPRKVQLVTVGDRVTEDSLRVGANPVLAVYDCREVRRERGCPPFVGKLLEARNPPGMVSWEAVSVLEEALEHVEKGVRVAVRVVGEEDLLVLPIVAGVSHGWVVAYGQPGVGVVTVKVDWYAKRLAIALAEKMEIIDCLRAVESLGAGEG